MIMKHIVYGNWWIAVCAAALTQLAYHVLGGAGVSIPLLVFVFGATLVVYNLNMLSGLEALRASGTTSVRHRWCMAHERAMQVYMGLGAAMAMGSFFMLSMRTWWLLAPAAVVAVLYVLPVVGGAKLREVGLWKIFLIATVWSIVTVGLPAAQMEHWPSTLPLVSLCVERALFVFAITIPFDIRDLRTDAQKGVRTLPSVLGQGRAKAIAVLALAVFVGMAALRVSTTGQWPMLVAYAFTAAVSGVLVCYANEQRSDMYCSFWLDGMMVLLAASVWLAMLV
jgi:4-hydroxybenzoate polyprenyltransferase